MLYYTLAVFVLVLVALRVDRRNYKRNMKVMRLKADVRLAANRLARRSREFDFPEQTEIVRKFL